MIDLCENGGGCDVHANCTMIGPGVKRYDPCYMQASVYNSCLFIQFFKLVKMVLFFYRCDCKNGYRGNGTICYGNILQVNNIFNENTAWMFDTLSGSYLMLLNYQISNCHVVWLCNNGYIKLDWLTSLAKLNKNWGSHCQKVVFLSYIER